MGDEQSGMVGCLTYEEQSIRPALDLLHPLLDPLPALSDIREVASTSTRRDCCNILRISRQPSWQPPKETSQGNPLWQLQRKYSNRTPTELRITNYHGMRVLNAMLISLTF